MEMRMSEQEPGVRCSCRENAHAWKAKVCIDLVAFVTLTATAAVAYPTIATTTTVFLFLFGFVLYNLACSTSTRMSSYHLGAITNAQFHLDRHWHCIRIPYSHNTPQQCRCGMVCHLLLDAAVPTIEHRSIGTSVHCVLCPLSFVFLSLVLLSFSPCKILFQRPILATNKFHAIDAHYTANDGEWNVQTLRA